MRTHGKHYRAAVGTLEPRKLYPPRDAVERVKAAAYAKFDESVDVAVRLGVDPKHADQIVRGTVSLPHGTGKKIRVLVIAQGDKAKEAEAAGADFVGVEYVQKIKEGCDKCRAQFASCEKNHACERDFNTCAFHHGDTRGYCKL